jgi:hypothetical protein
MHIHEAIKHIGEKAEILKSESKKAIEDDKKLIDFVSMMLEQYFETEGNKKRMNSIFTSEVMKCLIEYARMINAFADIKLMDLQLREEDNN